MKKILVILTDDPDSQQPIIQTAINIARLSSCTLHAVFMLPKPELEYSYYFPTDLSLTGNLLTGKTCREENSERLASCKKLFARICIQEKIKFVLEDNDDISLKDLAALSAFDDLILTDAPENISDHPIIDLFTGAHCPVYLVSKYTYKTEQIVLTYDGSYPSIHAIKRFSQLFPQMLDLPCHLVHIATDEADEFPREKNIKSWLPPLFNNVAFKLLHGDVKDELVNYISSVPGSLAVMGSFGRSKFSRSFQESLAYAVIAGGRSALFICHE